ncbi:DUF1302 domain-containing protein [Pseudomonas panipatensis]|uniref:Type V secretory pathway, adhesin AidA n=1 Tax=Pseudomonas panipatensis TaxID=428992 RepID=A0A1G8E694_9PSED|nr:DUF1302 domain-containing protein [Pseudomonas panipatensis]SDH65230.1 Protein of unknown function [Pseudomonas panipatensis]SMP38408.1 Protein of unknown function [Pseudomonas panipatensis]
MTTLKTIWRLARLPLAVSLASSLAAPASAVTFNIGEIEGSFDSSLSVGASWSTQNPDKNLIGVNNGGKGLSQTSDDGHLNYRAGETFSKIFKGIHDLELKYGDSGVFLRGKYWYDFEQKDEGTHFKAIDDEGRKSSAQASGAELLDAFVYHKYSIADLPGNVRLGKQVVNWGESTFIQNGISVINPVDVTAFRRPGSEIKEALVPVNMFYLSQNLTDNLSAEGFYQLEWQQTVLDNCGTFFSQPDVVANGCTQNLAVLSNNRSAINALNGLLGPSLAVTQSPWGEGVVVRRGPDHDPSDSGQYGLSLKYFADKLNTEFGGYFINYHSRLPIFSGSSASVAQVNQINALATRLAGVSPTLAAQAAAVAMAGNSSYFIEYPENIHLYGLSFSTTLPTGTAWSGEISYRPNAPVQLNTTDILYAGLNTINIGGNQLYDNASVLNGQAGQDINGYERKAITQLQTTFTQFFDQVMGAERLTMVGEIGWTHVGGLESQSKARYGRDPVFGPGPLAGTLNGKPTCEALNTSTLAGGPQNNVSRYCESEGYTTADSWGYRMRAIWDYNDVFAGVNLKPNVAWSHDVSGYSPGPGGNFEEGRKAISLGVDADYQNTYTASLSYTNYFDGKYSTLVDRDFVALSFGVNF